MDKTEMLPEETIQILDRSWSRLMVEIARLEPGYPTEEDAEPDAKDTDFTENYDPWEGLRIIASHMKEGKELCEELAEKESELRESVLGVYGLIILRQGRLSISQTKELLADISTILDGGNWSGKQWEANEVALEMTMRLHEVADERNAEKAMKNKLLEERNEALSGMKALQHNNEYWRTAHIRAGKFLLEQTRRAEKAEAERSQYNVLWNELRGILRVPMPRSTGTVTAEFDPQLPPIDAAKALMARIKEMGAALKFIRDYAEIDMEGAGRYERLAWEARKGLKGLCEDVEQVDKRGE